ncbi:DUF2244 domain-containing protein [Pontivivens ytuae]|uniref:DUF2244 domain-containing protein n=1 Tax=Pontivivens ytuae TaxID=2789856 RepID=A0A7S9LR38_9RHOB|nr:DUF2244 domain-containing protein [Pontivivens ytuae]QPH53576.1 DUF2244 domain-containing protein [Pontivivens ytuae]
MVETRQSEPILSLTLWPHQSLTAEGFEVMSWVIGLGLALPVVPFIGTPVFWGLLPFVGGAFLLFRWMVRYNQRKRRLREELRIWPDLITVERIEADGTTRDWQANPHWVRVQLREDAKIENYLTLKGAGREIELGAFLSPEERVALKEDLERALVRAY